MNPTAEQVIENLKTWNENQATIKKSLMIDLHNWIYLTK